MTSNQAKPEQQKDEKLRKFFDLEDDHDRKTVDKTAFRKLLSYILAERALLLSGSVLLIITTLVVVYEPRFLGLMIDEALAKKDTDALKYFVGVFFLLHLVRVITTISQEYLFNKLGQNVMQTLRVELFHKLQTLPSQTFNRVPVGKLVTRVTNDVSSLADMFTAGFITILGSLLYVLGIITWLIVLNPRLGAIAISVLPFLIGISIYFSQKLKVAYRTARSKLSTVNAFLAENILGIKVIFLHNREKLHLEKFSQLNSQYAVSQFASTKVFALFQPSITMATGIAMALIIWFGGKLVVGNEITIGFLASYFAYVLSLFQPVREIADKWNIFLAGMASVERIFSILEWEPESDLNNVNEPTTSYSELMGHIEFKNVWFAYDGENWVLKDFSFEIKPGEKIGIVGPTGSGKTTLINLILRFYDPQKGEILIDGKPLATYDKRRLRSTIGLIQQDVFLFSGSIAENMALWRKFDPNVRENLRSISTFRRFEEQGLEDESALQERGGNLSMGERQILAFGRALHTNPQLWILDEATSNMDSESEKELEELLKRSAQKKSLIMIAHRLASVREADKILVLQNGVLTESGRHSELMSKDGLYSRRYRFQEMD